jgi:hypothetical protein
VGFEAGQVGSQAVDVGLVRRPVGDLLGPGVFLAALVAELCLARLELLLGPAFELVVLAELEDLGQDALALGGRVGGEAVGPTLLDE